MFKFALREFGERISLCFTTVKITKTSQKTRNFFGADFFVCFEGFVSSFPEIQETFQEWVLLTFRGRKVAS